MDIEQIRSALTSEINPTSLSELDENELASVLIIIYGKDPFNYDRKSKNFESTCW